jgi:hypothetical protein
VQISCDVNAAMFSCQGSVCHGQPGLASTITLGAGLDLFTADRETVLVNKEASYIGVLDPENCPTPGELLIDTANPMASLILTKLTEGAHACGSLMPSAGTIDAMQMACVQEWVIAVATAASASAGVEAAQQQGNGGSTGF